MIERLEGQELSPGTAEASLAAPVVPPAGETERFAPEESPRGAIDVPVGAGPSLEAPPESRLAPEVPAGLAAEAEEPLIRLEPGDLRGVIEALLFSISEPVPIRSLADLLGVSVHDAREAVEELRLEYIDMGRSFRVEDIAGGVQVLTLSKFDPWIRRLREKERESRLSPAALESLAVIAYKQPISKADLEGIRGVGCGPTLKTLLDRGLIQIVGRGEGLGKPLLYGTTRRFLESFGIASVRDLPQPELLERPREEPARVEAPRVAALEAPAALGTPVVDVVVAEVEPSPEAAGAEESEAEESAESQSRAAAPSLADADGPLS